jgi:hypothetical protein
VKALAAALLMVIAGCRRGGALEGACANDGDCASGFHCIAGTGVCARFTTPLDGIDAGGADLGPAPDLRPRDGGADAHAG